MWQTQLWGSPARKSPPQPPNSQSAFCNSQFPPAPADRDPAAAAPANVRSRSSPSHHRRPNRPNLPTRLAPQITDYRLPISPLYPTALNHQLLTINRFGSVVRSGLCLLLFFAWRSTEQPQVLVPIRSAVEHAVNMHRIRFDLVEDEVILKRARQRPKPDAMMTTGR